MKKCILALTLIVLIAGTAFASETYYTKGDTLFSFKAGIVVPAFLSFTNNENYGFETGSSNIHAKLGGEASLSYQIYLNSKFALGGEIGYSFVKSMSDINFTTIPATVKATYVPVQTGKFDVYINGNLGIALLKYDSSRFLTPFFVSLGINPVYYIGNSWGIGIETGIYADLEFYLKNQSRSKDTCLAGFLPVKLTLCYRH